MHVKIYKKINVPCFLCLRTVIIPDPPLPINFEYERDFLRSSISSPSNPLGAQKSSLASEMPVPFKNICLVYNHKEDLVDSEHLLQVTFNGDQTYSQFSKLGAAPDSIHPSGIPNLKLKFSVEFCKPITRTVSGSKNFGDGKLTDDDRSKKGHSRSSCLRRLGMTGGPDGIRQPPGDAQPGEFS